MFKHKLYKNKTAVILGAGKSGLACGSLLKKKGIKFCYWDENKKITPKKDILDYDFFIKSPGISWKHKVLKQIKKAKKPIFSELEVAISYLPKNCKIFAITGTNGKTTTTTMLGAILKEYSKEEGKHRQVYVVGNIGTPIASKIGKIKENSLVVVEVSSYQLEDSTYFNPHASAILNITPDHLEHHGSYKKYIEAKAKIFKSQKGEQVLVINGTDEVCSSFAKKAKCRIFSFSSTPKKILKSDVFYDGDEIIFASGYHIKPPKDLIGIHNIENVMAASLVAFACGVHPSSVQRAMDKFKNIEHRIEYFATKKGVKYYNDSKATNVDSTLIALKALQTDKKLWLILGGLDKGAPYSPLAIEIRKTCKHIVLIGSAAPKIAKELKNLCPITDCKDLQTAVKFIYKNAKKGEVCLLSPACASFDQFKSFEHRGQVFKELVSKLK